VGKTYGGGGEEGGYYKKETVYILRRICMISEEIN
jgi:hypothetical protein